MDCIQDKNLALAILITHLYISFCKLISKIYKTDYAGFLVLGLYIFKLMYIIDPEDYSPFMDVFSCMLFIWLQCFVAMISDSVFSHAYFVILCLHILNMLE